MKEIGATLLERKFATWAKLTATFHQSDQVITAATRGPGGFALDETLYQQCTGKASVDVPRHGDLVPDRSAVFPSQ
jgi:hypothetical protein